MRIIIILIVRVEMDKMEKIGKNEKNPFTLIPWQKAAQNGIIFVWIAIEGREI